MVCLFSESYSESECTDSFSDSGSEYVPDSDSEFSDEMGKTFLFGL